MVTIQQTEQGVFFDQKFFFGSSETLEAQEGIICLLPTLGEDMRYKKQGTHIVDFPGEYDIDGIGVFCFLGAGNKLSFFVEYQGDKFALIQTPDVLEAHAEISSAKTWFYTEETVRNKLEQLELEGEKIALIQQAPLLG